MDSETKLCQSVNNDGRDFHFTIHSTSIFVYLHRIIPQAHPKFKNFKTLFYDVIAANCQPIYGKICWIMATPKIYVYFNKQKLAIFKIFIADALDHCGRWLLMAILLLLMLLLPCCYLMGMLLLFSVVFCSQTLFLYYFLFFYLFASCQKASQISQKKIVMHSSTKVFWSILWGQNQETNQDKKARLYVIWQWVLSGLMHAGWVLFSPSSFFMTWVLYYIISHIGK